ncbi:hypothetical protein OAN53_01030 [Porticoccaceae bacterium]|nr:hypothetical protein [Porticoccaceae bacterium]
MKDWLKVALMTTAVLAIGGCSVNPVTGKSQLSIISPQPLLDKLFCGRWLRIIWGVSVSCAKYVMLWLK